MIRDNNNQIIITGGAGFIGINLVKKLIKLGYFPIIIDNLSNSNISELKNIPKNSYYLIKSDINNENEILKELEVFSPKILIHLAALHYIPFCIKNPLKTRAVNIQGTKNIFKISMQKKIQDIIFTSSGAVYKPSYKAHKEEDKLQPIDIYGKTKKEAEEFLLKNCKKYKINLTILRLFNIYGKFDLTPHFIPEIIKRLKRTENLKVGNLKTKRDYLYIDDLLDVFIKILTIKDYSYNILNIGTGNTCDGAEVIKLISSIKKKNIQIIEDISLLRKTDRPILCADIKKVSKILNWIPRYGLKKGLEKLL
jgi:UDP-glucose 4-epimerase